LDLKGVLNLHKLSARWEGREEGSRSSITPLLVTIKRTKSPRGTAL